MNWAPIFTEVLSRRFAATSHAKEAQDIHILSLPFDFMVAPAMDGRPSVDV
jgi:hypothetical protein